MDHRTTEGTTSSIPDSDAVVAHLTASLSLDRLRTLAIQRLENDEQLQHIIEAAVQHSKALDAFTGEHSNRQLISNLQAELGGELSREALRALWRVLTQDEAGVSSQIDDAIRAALCQLHAQELQPNGEEPKPVP